MRKPDFLFVLPYILFVRCRSAGSNYSMFYGDAGHTGGYPGSHAGHPLISGYFGNTGGNLYAVLLNAKRLTLNAVNFNGRPDFGIRV